MKKNMGPTDKILRLLGATLLVILIAAKVATGGLAWVFAAIAVMFALTSAFGFCPLYVPFGISTCPPKKKE
jgi:hypothetical protein